MIIHAKNALIMQIIVLVVLQELIEKISLLDAYAMIDIMMMVHYVKVVQLDALCVRIKTNALNVMMGISLILLLIYAACALILVKNALIPVTNAQSV